MKYKDFNDWWNKEQPDIKFPDAKTIALEAWDVCVNSFPMMV